MEKPIEGLKETNLKKTSKKNGKRQIEIWKEQV